MFGKTKDGPSDSERAPAPVQQFHRSAVASSSSSPGATDEVSSISSAMTIVGKISGDGIVKIFGRVEGELRAASVLVSEGAEFEGDLVAEEVTVGGHVKGSIHANRVKLNGSAAVEGDIFHRSLSIEENARFEGSSRREEAVADTPRLPLIRLPSQLQPQSPVAAIDSGHKLNGDNAAHAKPAAE